MAGRGGTAPGRCLRGDRRASFHAAATAYPPAQVRGRLGLGVLTGPEGVLCVESTQPLCPPTGGSGWGLRVLHALEGGVRGGTGVPGPACNWSVSVSGLWPACFWGHRLGPVRPGLAAARADHPTSLSLALPSLKWDHVADGPPGAQGPAFALRGGRPLGTAAFLRGC